MKVPMKRSRLNKILKDQGDPGKLCASPYWNSGGYPRIMSLDMLETEYQNTMLQRSDKGWSEDDMKAVREDLERKGSDTTNVKAPAKDTLNAYSNALLSFSSNKRVFDCWQKLGAANTTNKFFLRYHGSWDSQLPAIVNDWVRTKRSWVGQLQDAGRMNWSNPRRKVSIKYVSLLRFDLSIKMTIGITEASHNNQT